MIMRILPGGREEAVELKDIRKGDRFYTELCGARGPILEATADAEQRPHSKNKKRMVWNVDTVRG